VALSGRWMVALKSDGSLWVWKGAAPESVTNMVQIQPTRLGIHNDWVDIGSTFDGIVSLAADGSLWFWPKGEYFDEALIKPPKQPEFLGNVLGKAD